MHKLRARLKRLIAYSLYYTGTLWIYAAFKLKGRAVALTYHRVLPEEADSFSTRGIVVSPASFELQMDFLHRHFTILSADQFHACLARGAFPRRACLITFDDGWSDNDRFALPILERLGIPAVLFIATGYVGTGTVFWQEELTRWLYAASRSSTKATELLDELGIGAACGVTDTEARRIVRDFVTGMKSTEPTEVTRILTGKGQPMAVPTIYQFDALLRRFRKRTYPWGMRGPLQRIKRHLLNWFLPK